MDERQRELSQASFRWAKPEDREEIFGVLSSAFGYPRGSAKWKQAARLVRARHASFRVLSLDDQIVGLAHLSRLPLQIGRSLVELAYIGQVAIAPQRQRQGLGTLLVTDLLHTLESSDYDVARLSGLVRFYSRFGWTPFGRRFVEFPLQGLQAGTAHIPLAEILAPSPTAAGIVRDYRSETDRRRRDELLRKFNYHRTGSTHASFRVPSNPFTHLPPRRRQVVYEQQDRLLGYVATHHFREDVSDFEASVNLREVAFDFDYPEAVAETLKYVLREASARGARRVTARLPWDARLFAVLRHTGLVYERVELLNPLTGNMLRLLNLRSLLQKLTSELSHRWARHGTGAIGVLRLQVEDRVAELQLGSRRVKLLESGAGRVTHKAELTQFEFLALLLGLAPVDAVVATLPDSPDAADILRALFPVQPTASSSWG